MPSIAEAAAALRNLVVPFAGVMSREELDRRLDLLDSGIADVRNELEDVRSQVDEFVGVKPLSRIPEDLG